MKNKLIETLEEQKLQTEQFNQKISGLLGIPLGGQRRIEVAGRNAYVYVRLRSNQSEVIQAYNNKVASSYNLPVLVERKGNRYEVVGVDTQRYENNWNSQSPFLPRHGNTHSFDIETGGGGDIVWVYPRQFTPAMVMPSGSSGADAVIIHPYTLENIVDGTWKQIGNTGTSSFLPYVPSSPTGAIMALVYIDTNTGNPNILINSGTVFSNSITGSSQVSQFIPAIPSPHTQIPIAAIRLITGTSAISWDNIYDVRQFVHTIPSGSSGGGGLSSIPVQDEGSALGNATTFNFVGSGVQATISGSVAKIDVSGGSINTGTLDARYLKLDASNAPVLAPLTISGSVIVSTPSSKLVGSSTIYSGTTNTSNEVLLTRSANISHTGVAAYEGYGLYLQDTHPLARYVGGLIYHRTKTGRETFVNPYAPSGTVAEFVSEIDIGTSGSLMSLKNQGVQKFNVDGAGNANISSGSTYNINGSPHTHSGVGGLSNSNISPTTADLTLTVGVRHFVDASGLTADRALKFPTGSDGDQIEIRMIGEHPNYACKLQGDTGINVEGLTASEWDRLYHSGMALSFVYRDSDGWRVISDNRNGLIRKVILTGSVSSVDFTNIPQRYTNLKMQASARTDRAGTGGDAFALRFNGHTGTSYDAMQIAIVHSASLSTNEILAATYLQVGTALSAGNLANAFSTSDIVIPNYASSSVDKGVFVGAGRALSAITGNIQIRNAYGTWKSTNPITGITIIPVIGANLVAGCSFSLYGE